MKHIILTAFIGLSLSSWAQDFPIPYNPDSDLNGLIGSPDLLSLLAVYGEEFSAAVVAEDNESAIMLMGDMSYPECAQNCKNLPGMWDIAAIEDMGLIWEDLQVNGQYAWLRLKSAEGVYQTNSPGELDIFPVLKLDANPENIWVSYQHRPGQLKRCYCSIKELPKVEYTSVGNSNYQDWIEVCQEKVANGWYPIPGSPTANWDSNMLRQAFWRWAE